MNRVLPNRPKGGPSSAPITPSPTHDNGENLFANHQDASSSRLRFFQTTKGSPSTTPQQLFETENARNTPEKVALEACAESCGV